MARRKLERPMIEIHNGTYEFNSFKLAIDLNISKGEFCAVLGPSGAGKSTLLSIIAGFENLSQGTFLLDGKPANAEPADRPVSMVFQDHNVFSHMSVWDNVALGISPNLRLSDAQNIDVKNALYQVGLRNLEQRKPGEVSGGERQRIALARVLVRNRPILLLDEPFAALDPGLCSNMLSLVSEIQIERGLTVLLVTHQPEDAKKVRQKIVFIAGGKVNDAVPNDLFFASHDHSILQYLGNRTGAFA
jgi:thiamine transport system ATP-binding protein